MRIFFVLNVYHESKAEVLAQCQTLLDTYQESQVCVIFDGGPSATWANELNGLGDRFHFRTMSHRKTPENKGRWTDDYLREFLKSDKPICIKLDVDTFVGAHLTYLPQNERAVFGRVTSKTFIHGGAIGFTRKAAQDIVDSGYLLDPRLPNFKGLNDPLVRIVTLKLRITILDHSDIYCPCPFHPLAPGYAFTHAFSK